MNTKGKVFSIFTGCFAVSVLFTRILQEIYLMDIFHSYQVQSLSIIWSLMWLSTAIFFFICKDKVGKLVSLSVYSILTLIDLFNTLPIYQHFVDSYLVSTIFNSLAAITLTLMSILFLAKVKAVRYISFIPLTIYIVTFVMDIIPILNRLTRGGYYGGYVEEYYFFYFLIAFFELLFYLFAGLFFCTARSKVKATPATYPQVGYNANPVFCSKCGRANPAGSRYCMSCNSMLSDKKYCANCRGVNPASNQFCSVCGNRFVD